MSRCTKSVQHEFEARFGVECDDNYGKLYANVKKSAACRLANSFEQSNSSSAIFTKRLAKFDGGDTAFRAPS